jgi:hypothetical protein
MIEGSTETPMTFKMVRARQTPPTADGPKSGVVARNRPGSVMLCWLCTTPLGDPLVPLV